MASHGLRHVGSLSVASNSGKVSDSVADRERTASGPCRGEEGLGDAASVMDDLRERVWLGPRWVAIIDSSERGVAGQRSLY